MILLRARTKKRERTEKKNPSPPPPIPNPFSISYFSHAPVTSWDNNKRKVNIDQA